MKVKRISSAGIEPVYNMTVEDCHNYLIRGGIILKNCDAARYYAVTRTLGAQMPEPTAEEDSGDVDYDDSMTGGEMSDDYMGYGG